MSPSEIVALASSARTAKAGPRSVVRENVIPGGSRSGWPGQLYVVLADVAAVTGLLFGSWWVGVSLGLASSSLTIPLIAAATFLLGSFVSGKTYATVRQHPVAEFRHTYLSIFAALGIALLASALTPEGSWGTLFLLATTMGLFLGVIPTTRYLARHTGSCFSWWGRRAIIVGGGERAVHLFEMLMRKKHLGLRPLGLMENLDELSFGAKPVDYLGPASQLERLAAEQRVSLGILVVEDGGTPYLDLIHEGTVLTDWILVTSPGDWPSLWVEPRELGGLPSLVIRNHLLFPAARRIKRALDLVLSVAIGIFLWPIYAAIALAICCTDRGNILYSQERIGINGLRFRAWKFRTMHPSADAVLKEHLDRDPQLRVEWEKDHKLRNDPRVTWIGKILRKTSLDELPQLWNVFRGEMSLVGPRPIVEAEIPKYGQHYEQYEKVLPGITGLWQISGRNNTSYEERVAYDAFYVRNWSPWFDLYILACTVKVVLRAKGLIEVCC